eukprot:TRINITY_DN19475_c0_g1_i1.p1 TRINITY_DN19475_c0_g1~~TRINITY_DN19475_c0_g1_i1.p1  ORF type:complete len:1684 (+),score=416.09 TRINITY_DN19475_c0_g1_i1:163-5214(+)
MPTASIGTFEYVEGPEGGIVEGMQQLYDFLLLNGGGCSDDGTDRQKQKEAEYRQFREQGRDRELDLSGEMLDRLSTHLNIEPLQNYTDYQTMLKDMHDFYDPFTGDESMLSWSVSLPQRWELVVPKTAMRRAALFTEEVFIERGGCRFYPSELWCPDGKHYSRCANGSPTCCILHNLASVINGMLTDQTQDAIPWAALERMGVSDALEGIMACFLYTYNAQCPNDPSTPSIPRAQERPIQIYSALNLCMREVGDPHTRAKNEQDVLDIYLKALDIMRPLIKRLDLFVRNLPKSPKILYRGLSGHQVSKRYAQGALVTWPAFTSTSGEPDIAWWFTGEAGGTWFVIFADEEPAVDISWISMYPVERELLLPCNQVLKVAFKPGDSVLTTLRTNNDVVILHQMTEGGNTMTPEAIINIRMQGMKEGMQVTFAGFRARYVEPKLSLNNEHAPDDMVVGLFEALGCEGGEKPRKAVVTGNAGSGKTSAMLSLGSYSSNDDVLKLFVSLPSIPNVLSPDDPPCLLMHIAQRLTIDLSAIECLKTKKVLLLLDSLDECIGSAAYLKDPGSEPLLRRLNIRLEDWPNMRVVLSARTEYLRYWNLDAAHILGEDTQLYFVQRFCAEHIEEYVRKVGKEQVNYMVKMIQKNGVDAVSNDKMFGLLPNEHIQKVAAVIDSHGPGVAKDHATARDAVGALSKQLLKIINRLSSDIQNAFQLSMAVDAAPELICGDGRWQVYSRWCAVQVEKKLRKLSPDVQKYILPKTHAEKVEYLLDFCEKLALSLFSEDAWHGEVGPHVVRTAKMADITVDVAMELLKTVPLRVEDVENTKSQFSFVHRSLHEFLLARALFRAMIADNDSVVATILSHWSLACGSSNMVDLFGEAVRSSLRMNFAEGKKVVEILWYNIQLSRDWTGQRKCCSAVNSMSLLVATGVDLSGVDFRGIKIPTARLLGGHFKNSDFTGADLRAVDIREACLDGCDFTGAWLDDWVCGFSKVRLPLRIGLLPMLSEQCAIIDIKWNRHTPQILAVLTKERVAVYDVDAVRLVGEHRAAHPATAVAWHPSLASSIAIATEQGSVTMWDFTNNSMTNIATVSDAATGLIFTEQAPTTLLCTAGNTLHAFTLSVTCCVFGRKTGVKSLQFDSPLLGTDASPKDPGTALVWAADASFSIVDVASMTVTWRQELASVVTHAALNPASSHIAVATKSGSIELHCYKNKSFLKTLGAALPFEHYYTKVNWARSPDFPPSLLATVATDSFVRVMCSMTDARFPKAEGRQAEVHAVGWHPTRSVLATGCAQGNVRFINASSGKEGRGCTEVRETNHHSGTVTTIAWHPTKESIIGSGSSDGSARGWSVPSGDVMAVHGVGSKVRYFKYDPFDGSACAEADATQILSIKIPSSLEGWRFECNTSIFDWATNKDMLYYLDLDTAAVRLRSLPDGTEERVAVPGRAVHFDVCINDRSTIIITTAEALYILKDRLVVYTIQADQDCGGFVQAMWRKDGERVAALCSNGAVMVYDKKDVVAKIPGSEGVRGVRWCGGDKNSLGVFNSTTVTVHYIESDAEKPPTVVRPCVGEIRDVRWHPALHDVFACCGSSWGIEVYGRHQLSQLTPLLAPFDPSSNEYQMVRRISQPIFTAAGARIDTATCNENFWLLARSYGATPADHSNGHHCCIPESPQTPSSGCTTACARFCTSR